MIRILLVLGSGIVLVFDGACRESNPGRASYGFVIRVDDEMALEFCDELPGLHTSNQAEYLGLVRGLQTCRDLGHEDITVVGDSQLVIRQMSGTYRVWSKSLAVLHREAATLAKEIGVRSWEWRPRTDSLCRSADRLANLALDTSLRR